MGKSKKLLAGFTLLVFCFVLNATVQAAKSNDDFILGYATAIVAEYFPSYVKTIRVDNGTVYLEDVSLSETDKSKIHKMLSKVDGVRRVEFVQRQTGAGIERLEKNLPVFLPSNSLFQPLLADPRWPNFSASFQRYLDDDQLRNVGAASFGESFSIFRFRGPWDSIMEFGLQAGVFSIFDLNTESSDLINADYFFGIPIILKKSNFSNMLRIFHQSSHLGDEFLLRGNTNNRINLTYESVDNILSYNLPAGFRIYAGGGYLFHQQPSDLDPWSTQAGLEFRSPKTFFGNTLRPVACVDIQNRQESDWNTDISARTGVQFENPDFLSRKLLLLIEYYNGRSPNGQFYERSIEFIGMGLHLYY